MCLRREGEGCGKVLFFRREGFRKRGEAAPAKARGAACEPAAACLVGSYL